MHALEPQPMLQLAEMGPGLTLVLHFGNDRSTYSLPCVYTLRNIHPNLVLQQIRKHIPILFPFKGR